MAETATTPPSSRPSQEHTLDVERINLLRSLCDEGDTSMLRELVDAWKTESKGRLSSIKAAIESERLELLRREAHALKGCCTNLGANRLAEMSRRMEKEVTTTEAAQSLFFLMLEEHKNAEGALQAEIAA